MSGERRSTFFIQYKHFGKTKSKQKIANHNFVPAFDKIIDANYSNNEAHRAFSRENLGENFKFNVQFMAWMEENKGKKTYNNAIEMYLKMLVDKKSGKKTEIGRQFEYNQYMRDFFANNPKLSKEEGRLYTMLEL